MSYPFLALQPTGLTPADEYVRMGFEAHQAGKLPDAERLYMKAIALEPNHAIATNNLGLVHVAAGMIHLALLDLERAVLFAPDHPVIRANWAFVLLAGDRPLQAVDVARTALALAEPHPTEVVGRAGYILSRQALATALSATGRADHAAPLHAEALSLNATNFGSGIASCFLPTLRDVGPEQALPPRAAWRAAHGYKGAKHPHFNDKDPDRPLRVGYVSGDFKVHSAAMIFAQVLLNHTPNIVPYFYATAPVDPKTDLMTERFMLSAGRLKANTDEDEDPELVEEGHRWRNIAGVSDVDADHMIRDDEIDVLVDLSGHTNANRLQLFTRKPAPVQVTAWGFAVGTGCPEIDAFLADRIVVPEEEREHYAEEVIYLPCVMTYRPPVETAGTVPPSPSPLAVNEYVTFGCFGRFEKMSDAYLAAVREILNRVPNSRAYFKDHGFKRPDHIRRVRDALGVDPSRLIFAMGTAHIDHMRAYQQCDLFLDTFPHTMGETILEACYMGVPTVTLYGKAPAARLASSVLMNIGRGDWVARSVGEYVEKAIGLANNLPVLTAVRKTLRTELLESPVIKGYVEAVEDAYRWLWRKWCKTEESHTGELNGQSRNGSPEVCGVAAGGRALFAGRAGLECGVNGEGVPGGVRSE